MDVFWFCTAHKPLLIQSKNIHRGDVFMKESTSCTIPTLQKPLIIKAQIVIITKCNQQSTDLVSGLIGGRKTTILSFRSGSLARLPSVCKKLLSPSGRHNKSMADKVINQLIYCNLLKNLFSFYLYINYGFIHGGILQIPPETFYFWKFRHISGLIQIFEKTSVKPV